MIYTTLLQHQIDAVNFLRGHNPCALFLKLGRGKSLIALAYASYIGAKRILITSDKNNIVNTWPEQVSDHTDFEYHIRPDLTTISRIKHDLGYRYNNDTRESWVATVCVLVNYDFVSTRWDQLQNIPFDLWIGDESAEFKDQRTARHKHLAYLVKDIPNKVILNGEPMSERLEDLYGQFKLLDGGKALGKTMTAFRYRYMQPSPDGYGWVPQRSAYTRVQEAVRHISFWSSDTGDVKMPERKFHMVRVEMTEDQKTVDDRLRRDMSMVSKGQPFYLNYATDIYNKRVQLCGGTILPPYVEGDVEREAEYVATDKLTILNDMVHRNPGSKIVVWHQYVAETKRISEYLKENHIKHLIFDDTEKIDVLQEFRKRGGILLIRLSMCKGLNQLADGDIAVFYSNPFSYRTRAQAIGRTCRLSSKNMVTHIVDIITKGGADEAVYSMLSQKRNFSLTLGNLRSIVCSQRNKP